MPGPGSPPSLTGHVSLFPSDHVTLTQTEYTHSYRGLGQSILCTANLLTRHAAAIVSELATALPEAKIVLQGLMPRARKYAGRIRTLNGHYAKLAEQRGVNYLDLFPLFDDGSGRLRADLSYDGLHLLGPGYAVWRQALAPIVGARAPSA